jgi:hypothetical protein
LPVTGRAGHPAGRQPYLGEGDPAQLVAWRVFWGALVWLAPARSAPWLSTRVYPSRAA